LETLRVVGRYNSLWNELTGQNLPEKDIFQSDGLAIHVQRHHPDTVSYIDYIEYVLADPDYVGHNPNVPNSIELIKVIDTNVLVSIKLDLRKDRLYVASVYGITDAKRSRMLQNGRIVPIQRPS